MNYNTSLQKNNLDLQDILDTINTLPDAGGTSAPNGTEWTQSNITSGMFSAVAYGNGIWVAAGDMNLYHSTDGVTWTESSLSSNSWTFVYFAEGLFVACGYSSGLYYSTDGRNWSKSNVTTKTFYDVFNVNGLWVACGSNSYSYSSTDGKSWSMISGTSGIFKCVRAACGIWVMGKSSGGFYSSTNGTSWTSNAPSNCDVYAVHNASGIWAAATSAGLYYSTNGTNWTKSNVSSGTYSHTYYANGLWVACGSSTGLYYSTDGKVWTSSNIRNEGFNRVHYVAGVWVACGSSTGLYYSTNGRSWTQSNITGRSINTANHGNSVRVACDNENGLYYSYIWNAPKQSAADVNYCTYIESTGTQYINTGYNPKYDTKVVLEISDVSSTTSQLFGAKNENSSTAALQYNLYRPNSTSFRSDYFGTNASANISDSTTRTTITKDGNVVSLYGTTITNTAVSSGEVPYSMYLFALNTAGTPMGYTSAKLYSCKIYDGSVLVRNYKPCLDPNGVVCLYDEVNGEYAYNAGSGDFYCES